MSLSGADNKVIMEAKGYNGQIELLADRLRIKRKGALAFLSQGLKGDKEILLSSISSVQFKKSGPIVNGYIQFAFIGGLEAKGGISQAVKDENTVIFTYQQRAAFDRLKDAIDEQRQKVLSNTSQTASSNLDELEKLASLRDRGIITEDEFQAKKKKLLD